MEQLTTSLAENQKVLDTLLGVGRNYDVISRDLYTKAKGSSVQPKTSVSAPRSRRSSIARRASEEARRRWFWAVRSCP